MFSLLLSNRLKCITSYWFCFLCTHIVFASKIVFPHKNCVNFSDLAQKMVNLKEVILQAFARTLKVLLKRCIVFKRISQDFCKFLQVKLP